MAGTNAVKRLYLDIDGVLANFVKGFCEVHGISDPYMKSENLGSGDLSSVTGWPPDRLYMPLEVWFWANLEKMGWANQLVELCESRFPDEVYLATKPTRNKGCCSGKHIWVQQHFPQYERKFMIGAPKHLLANSSSLLIDDTESNCLKFIDNGGYAILYPAPWNKLHNVNDKIEHVRKALEEL